MADSLGLKMLELQDILTEEYGDQIKIDEFVTEDGILSSTGRDWF
jgi:hypothetical protein